MKGILETKDLAIGYKRKEIARGLNLTLRKGEVTSLIGKNGAGKTTLIKTLTGNLKPLGGEVLINGKGLEGYNRKELAKIMAVVNTDPHIAGGLRLKELAGLGRIPYTGRLGLQSKRDQEIVTKALEETGVIHKKDSFISELSDGERQKGMIARGLAQETPIIIMDEPFSFLDVASRLEMMALLKRLAKEKYKSILLSTHEITDALRMTDKVWLILEEGVIDGSPDNLIARGAIDKIFLNTQVRFDKERKEFRLLEE